MSPRAWIVTSALTFALGSAVIGFLTVGQADLEPVVTDPPPGARAPASRMFGVALGQASLTDVQALTERLGATCTDNSMRALMADLRGRMARGDFAGSKLPNDPFHRALFSRIKTKAERNPQVRWSCEGVDLVGVPDVPSIAPPGRWLFVFDSPRAPLRHASFRRKHAAQADAVADFERAVQAATLAFGPPTHVEGRLVPGPRGEPTLPILTNVRRVWRFADVHVELTALARAPDQLDVLQAIEVPVGVRADAPTHPSPGPGRAPDALAWAEAPWAR